MFVLLKYWKVLTVAALLVATFFAGMHMESNARDAKELVVERKHAKDLVAEQERANKLAQNLATTKRERDAYFRKLGETKILDRPIYSGQCIDDDGRVLLNGYITGSELPSSGIHGRMPPASTNSGEHR